MRRSEPRLIRFTPMEIDRITRAAAGESRTFTDFARLAIMTKCLDLESASAFAAIADLETQTKPETIPETIPEPVDPSKPRSNRIKRPEGTPAPVFNFDATSTNTPVCPECFSTDTVFDWELDGDKFYKCLSCEAKNF